MRSGWERVIQGQAEKLLGEEAKIYSEAYVEVDGNIKKFEKFIDERVGPWSEMLRAAYEEILADFGGRTYDDLLKSSDSFEEKSKDFDPFHNLILSWSREWSAVRATLISESSKGFCNKVITRGIDANLPIDEIAKDLRKQYSGDKIQRSYKMARTEVVGASNYGSWQGAKQAEIPDMAKSWVSARDDRVRESHRDVDGQTVEMDEFFYVHGQQMNYPGDPAGPANETIMCRCAISYKTGGVAQKPSGMGPDLPERGELRLDSRRDIGNQITEDYAARGIQLKPSSGSMSEGNYVFSEADQLHGVTLRWSSERGATNTRYLQQYYVKHGKYPDVCPKSWYQGTDLSAANKVLADAIDDVHRLEKMIEVLPNYPKKKVLWRGIELSEKPQVYESLKTLKPGNIIDMKGTSSWAPNTKVASQFAEGGVKNYTADKSVMFVLEGGSNQSASISYLASYPKELELIISERSRFEVTKIVKGIAKDVLGPIKPGVAEAEKSRLYIILKEVR